MNLSDHFSEFLYEETLVPEGVHTETFQCHFPGKPLMRNASSISIF